MSRLLPLSGTSPRRSRSLGNSSIDPDRSEGLVFKQSGAKTLELTSGLHEVFYRALGLPNTPFSLEVTKGGDITKVDRTLPADGRAAGKRHLTVS
jgi:hypothetical protein